MAEVTFVEMAGMGLLGILGWIAAFMPRKGQTALLMFLVKRLVGDPKTELAKGNDPNAVPLARLVEEMSGRLDSVAVEIRDIRDQLTESRRDRAVLHEKVGALDSRVDATERAIEELEPAVKTLEGSVSDLRRAIGLTERASESRGAA